MAARCLRVNSRSSGTEATRPDRAPGTMALRVAVVGAGAAGLCAARHVLTRAGAFARPIVFEQSDRVGGTWCYDERTHLRGRPVHSSMYRDLRTNLPKEVMMFPDFPFEPQTRSFVTHQQVQTYLESYSRSHRVLDHIRFNTVVEKVEPVMRTLEGGASATTWEVTSSDASGGRTTETFDSVFVCSGHYSDPHLPHIPGLHNFKGTVLHSHSYRFPEPFSGQKVLVLGAKASGLDISLELAQCGAQVILSHARPALSFPLPPAIRQAGLVEAVDHDGSVRFRDGSRARVHALMFCTGYNFKYPFLEAEQLGLDLQDQTVAPLYRFMMPPAFPSLVFIGICKIICPFPNFHCQVQFALAALDGSLSLPSRSEMEEEVLREQLEKVSRGVERRHLLVLDQDQWDYCRTLAREGGFPALPPVVQSLYQEVWRQRRIHPTNYRRRNYRVVSASCWEEEEEGEGEEP